MFILRLTRIKLIIMAAAIIFLIVFSSFWLTRSSKVSEFTALPLEQIETDQLVIALTVNVDWGEEQIPRMLEILKTHNASATFFVTGRWAGNNTELVQQMAAQGHEIENHSYSHNHPDRDSIEKNKQEIIKTEEVIHNLIRMKTSFFAPPYGERGKNGLKAAEELGYTTVFWTLDTVDWHPSSTPEVITQRVLQPQARNGKKPQHKGAIVLMHPKENTVKALPTILTELQNQGYQFVTMKKLITF